MEVLLISDQELSEATPLGGNIDPAKFKLCIQDAQISALEEILGETLYEKLKLGGLSGDYQILLDKYVKPFLIRQAAIEYLLMGSYQVANGGIYKHTPSNGTPVEKDEVSMMVSNQKFKAEMYQERMQRFLDKTQFPEMDYNTDSNVNPTNSTGGTFDFI